VLLKTVLVHFHLWLLKKENPTLGIFPVLSSSAKAEYPRILVYIKARMVPLEPALAKASGTMTKNII
jgi:hypothetical protein